MSDDHAHASWKPFMGDLFSEYAATPFWAWIDVVRDEVLAVLADSNLC